MTNKTTVQLSVWSDYVCPFCYLELPEIERLQAEMGDRLQVDWRAFELRPEPEPTLDPDGAYLHRVWNASVYPMAAERGLELKLPPVQPRSRQALEAAEFARSRGRFDAVHRGLFEAFFRDGRDIGDPRVLGDVVDEAGLDQAELTDALSDGRFTPKVLADQSDARRFNIGGVPGSLVIKGDRGLMVSGAQPFATLKAAVEQILAA